MSKKYYSKQDFMRIERTNDLIKAVESIGYSEKSNHGGSHHVYECPGKPVISLVDHGHSNIAPGTLRNIVNLIFNPNYQK
jgi:predicted RNA binding protein YcfA (HicA-like mRNA interferase family)